MYVFVIIIIYMIDALYGWAMAKKMVIMYPGGVYM